MQPEIAKEAAAKLALTALRLRFKSDPQLKTIPVLMLTGSDASQTVVEGLNTGADDFVASDALASLMMTQLALDPTRRPVFRMS